MPGFGNPEEGKMDTVRDLGRKAFQRISISVFELDLKVNSK